MTEPTPDAPVPISDAELEALTLAVRRDLPAVLRAEPGERPVWELFDAGKDAVWRLCSGLTKHEAKAIVALVNAFPALRARIEQAEQAVSEMDARERNAHDHAARFEAKARAWDALADQLTERLNSSDTWRDSTPLAGYRTVKLLMDGLLAKEQKNG